MLTTRLLILSAMLAGTMSGQRLSTTEAKLVGQWEEYVIDAIVQIVIQPDHTFAMLTGAVASENTVSRTPLASM